LQRNIDQGIASMVHLNAKQEKAAVMLVSGMTAREVAAEVGVTAETISRWKADANFEAYMNQLRWEALDSARESLRTAARMAAQGLVEIIQNAKTEETKRKACRDVLELVGYTKPELWGWGAGETDPAKIEASRSKAALMSELASFP
jgi:transposase